MENWKLINDTYEVSDLGRFKSLPKKCVNNPNGSFFISKEKIMKEYYDKDGYRNIKLSGKVLKAHRIVAQTFIPNPDNLPEVNHINGIKNDNRVINLEWCTHRDNSLHAFETGLNRTKGSDNAMAKLTDNNIIEIIKLSKSIQQKEIAKLYNVSKATISRIINNKTYKL